MENGKLPCTYEHFVEFGLQRHAIAPAIRELVALGFVEITQQGCAGNAGYRQPTLYRLTYRHWGSHKETTDEWRRIKTMEEAETIARRARAPQSERGPKNKSPPPKTVLVHQFHETASVASWPRWTTPSATSGPDMVLQARQSGLI